MCHYVSVWLCESVVVSDGVSVFGVLVLCVSV